MGLKFIIFVALAWAVYALVRRALTRQDTRKRPEHGSPVDMVRCDHCGVHLPAAEALKRGNHWYCCQDHRDADQKQ